jgi:hypothetical protein
MQNQDEFGLALPVDARDAADLVAARRARHEHYQRCVAADPAGVAAFEQRTRERLARGRENLARKNLARKLAHKQ